MIITTNKFQYSVIYLIDLDLCENTNYYKNYYEIEKTYYI